MNFPQTLANIADNPRAMASDRLAELERQIAGLQHLIAELLVKNQQLRDLTRTGNEPAY